MTNNVSTLAAKPHDFVLRRAHLVIAGAVVITLVVAVFLYRQRAIEVELVAPRYEDIESTVSAKGNVFPTDDFAARATFSGVVDDIYVHLGEKVHRGQKLVQLRDQFAESRVNNARAALLSAELNDENLRSNGSRDDQISQATDLEKAQSEQAAAAKSFSTIERLRQVGSTSDAEVNSARQRLDTANALLQAAKQRSQARYRPLDLKSAEAKVEANRASLAGEKSS